MYSCCANKYIIKSYNKHLFQSCNIRRKWSGCKWYCYLVVRVWILFPALVGLMTQQHPGRPAGCQHQRQHCHHHSTVPCACITLFNLQQFKFEDLMQFQFLKSVMSAKNNALSFCKEDPFEMYAWHCKTTKKNCKCTMCMEKKIVKCSGYLRNEWVAISFANFKSLKCWKILPSYVLTHLPHYLIGWGELVPLYFLN